MDDGRLHERSTAYWTEKLVRARGERDVAEARVRDLEAALRANDLLTDKLLENAAVREMLLTSDAAIELLALHALTEIRCDHDLKRDLAICNCGTVNLGWWPTVQTAKEAWARHVLDKLDAVLAGETAGEAKDAGMCECGWPKSDCAEGKEAVLECRRFLASQTILEDARASAVSSPGRSER